MSRSIDVSSQRGFGLVQGVLLVALLSVCLVLTIRTARVMLEQARIADLAEAGQKIWMALDRYEAATGNNLSAGSDPGDLNLRTLVPLRGSYLTRADDVIAQLHEGRISAYDSGPDGSFWLLLVKRNQPQIQVLIADTADFPPLKGIALHGVYVFRGGELHKLHDSVPLSMQSHKIDSEFLAVLQRMESPDV